MVKIQKNRSLKKLTSFKIGGSAKYFAEPKSEDELIELFKWVEQQDCEIPIFILGKGSNILVSDSGWDGIVISTKHYNKILWSGSIAICQGGVLLNKLTNESMQKGYSDLVSLSGIPGSVGGGVIMNAGAFGSNISDSLVRVKIFDINSSEIKWIDKKDAEFGYRTSFFKKRENVILEIEFDFKSVEDIKSIENKYNDIITKRNNKQPLNLPNCGSVFKRPHNNFAGTLIEGCGLKGLTVNGAQISEKHANFIINKSDATADDVYQLINMIIDRVENKKGIKLSPEVIFVGSFE